MQLTRSLCTLLAGTAASLANTAADLVLGLFPMIAKRPKYNAALLQKLEGEDWDLFHKFTPLSARPKAPHSPAATPVIHEDDLGDSLSATSLRAHIFSYAFASTSANLYKYRAKKFSITILEVSFSVQRSGSRSTTSF